VSERGRRAGGPPPEALAELRASVRALREELEQRFGVGDSEEPDPGPAGELAEAEAALGADVESLGPELAAEALAVPSPRGGLFEQLRESVRARLEEIDVVKLYEALRERIAIPSAGDTSTCATWRAHAAGWTGCTTAGGGSRSPAKRPFPTRRACSSSRTRRASCPGTR